MLRILNGHLVGCVKYFWARTRIKFIALIQPAECCVCFRRLGFERVLSYQIVDGPCLLAYHGLQLSNLHHP